MKEIISYIQSLLISMSKNKSLIRQLSVSGSLTDKISPKTPQANTPVTRHLL